jgi:hypothetical protein
MKRKERVIDGIEISSLHAPPEVDNLGTKLLQFNLLE